MINRLKFAAGLLLIVFVGYPICLVCWLPYWFITGGYTFDKWIDPFYYDVLSPLIWP